MIIAEIKLQEETALVLALSKTKEKKINFDDISTSIAS